MVRAPLAAAKLPVTPVPTGARLIRSELLRFGRLVKRHQVIGAGTAASLCSGSTGTSLQGRPTHAVEIRSRCGSRSTRRQGRPDDPDQAG